MFSLKKFLSPEKKKLHKTSSSVPQPDLLCNYYWLRSVETRASLGCDVSASGSASECSSTWNVNDYQKSALIQNVHQFKCKVLHTWLTEVTPAFLVLIQKI